MTDQDKGSAPRTSPFDAIRHESEQYGEYWSGRELYKLLGYSRWERFKEALDRAINICTIAQQNVRKHFCPNHKLTQIGFGAQRRIQDYYLTRYALYLILASSDLCKSDVLKYFALITLSIAEDCRKFSIELPDTVSVTKEQITINQIVKAFSHLRSIRQFSVRPYFIDLYFPDHKIAVECDEYNHCSYDSQLELRRQKYLEKTLRCVFVRYNPDDRNFNIGDVIHQIMTLIYGSNALGGIKHG
jgi:very-short-patch-repair endonuclease